MITLLNSDKALSRAELDEIGDELYALPFAHLISGVGISGSCDSVLSVARCYHDAMKAMQSACESGGNKVCLYEDLDGAGNNAFGEKFDSSLSPVGSHSSDKKQTLAEDAKFIVDHNFTDPMMGVNYVSDILKVNNSYLSTVFKTAHGISMLQYINQLRMDYAKELLTTTESNVKDIALKVGFSSDISFIRAFRRLEGCTPTAFRSSNAVR